MARNAILERHGIKVMEMWETDWNARKEALPGWMRKGLEKWWYLRSIRTRDALKDGRAEVFQMYKKCGKGEHIFYFDVISLYPTVNALGDYAVGYP